MDSKQMCPEEFHTFISSATPYLLEVEGVKSLIGQAAKDEPRHNLNKLCLGGHIGVHFICAHQFLVKANVDRRYLQAWMEHMKAAQLMLPVVKDCLPQSVWPYDFEKMTAWLEEWIGPGLRRI